MPCPTCSHAMANVGITGNGGRVFHCPRCGTVSQVFPFERHNYVPKLVERYRSFSGHLIPASSELAAWNRLGLAESINLPADRPT